MGQLSRSFPRHLLRVLHDISSFIIPGEMKFGGPDASLVAIRLGDGAECDGDGEEGSCEYSSSEECEDEYERCER